MYLFLFLLLPFLCAIAVYLSMKLERTVKEYIVYVFSAILFLMLLFAYGRDFSFSFNAGGFGKILFRLDLISWFFSIIIVSFFILNIIYLFSYYKNKEKIVGDFFVPLFFLLLASLLGIVISKNLLMMFFFWEMMTWTSYILASYRGESARTPSLRYFIMSAFGAYAFLMALLIIFTRLGSLDMYVLAGKSSFLSPGYSILVFALFFIAFGVKSAIIPLHTWAPFAYTYAPDVFTPFFSGVLSKMGVYGFFVILYFIPIFKSVSVSSFFKIFGLSYPLYIIAFLGGLTALFASILAFLQDDAKKLLAFSSISHLGYIVVGLAVGTSLGVGGALFHALNHSIFKGMLFLAIAGVIYRTNTRKLSEMGGLLPNMPITFLTVLGGIIALAGIPPSGGFASKWMLYEALIEHHMVFLAALLFLATTASFLYVYRLIHSVFLGQRPVKFATIREVPIVMQVVMLIFLVFAYVFGVFPGLVLGVISNILVKFGFSPINHTMTQVASSIGHWNAFWAFNLLGWGFLVGLIFFFIGAPSRKISKLDTYAAGEIVGEDVPYNYSYYFYRPIEMVFIPYFKLSAHKIYETISRFLVKRSGNIRLWYSGNLQSYVLYFIVFMFLVLIFSKLTI